MLKYLAIPWIVFGVVWTIGAFRAKRAVRTEGTRSYLSHNIFLIVGALFLFGWPPIFRTRIIHSSVAIFIIALALTCLGIAFTIWARVLIAGNWSANVTIKEGHELTIMGPYHLV